METHAADEDNGVLLYRFFDFFELIESAKLGRLRVASVATFEDSNDLLGSGLLEKFGPLALPFPILDSDIEGLAFGNKPEHIFVSSWTKTRDSIAMWELYSPNLNSIQVAVSWKRIATAFSAYCDAHRPAPSREMPPRSPGLFLFALRDGPCEYLDFGSVFCRILESIRSSRDTVLTAIEDKELFQTRLDKLRKEVEKIIGNDSHLMKDAAYSHEQEHRFSFIAFERNDKSVEEIEKSRLLPLIEPGLDAAPLASTGGQIFIDFDWSCVEQVLLDPRLPDWKIDSQRKILGELGLDATKSRAYDFRPDGWRHS